MGQMYGASKRRGKVRVLDIEMDAISGITTLNQGTLIKNMRNSRTSNGCATQENY